MRANAGWNLACVHVCAGMSAYLYVFVSICIYGYLCCLLLLYCWADGPVDATPPPPPFPPRVGRLRDYLYKTKICSELTVWIRALYFLYEGHQ